MTFQILGNPKFYSSIWQLEQARTFLLLSGFEQVLNGFEESCEH